MQQNRLPMLLVGYLSGIITCIMISCANGPKVRVHISDPTRGGMDFYDQRTKESGFAFYAETDKFVCFNTMDIQTLLNYCGVGKQ